eukprot:PhF_6_TR8091/c0_g1_i1/m.12510/K17362/ACOT13; acyl-coenzyme A thioesterase 13
MRFSRILRSGTTKVKPDPLILLPQFFKRVQSTQTKDVEEFGVMCVKLVQFDPTKNVSVVSDNTVDFNFTVTPQSCNFAGFLHGGMYSVLGDCFTSAHIFVQRPKEMHVTVELSTSCASKAKLGSVITARSSLLKLGRQLAFTRIDFLDEKGQLCATVNHTKAFVPT